MSPEKGEASDGVARRWERWLPLGGLAVVVVAFRTLFDPSKILAIGDLAFFHLPLRTLLAEAAGQGFPWWNAALHGGQPILSNPNYAAFYPTTWLTFLLPAALAIQLTLLLHVAWAYAGAWRLARHLGGRPATALFAAIAFTAGGAFVSSATLLTLFCGLAWTPWILLWAGRSLEVRGPRWWRSAVLVGIGLSAQFLAGEPVNSILSGLALLGLGIDDQMRSEPRIALAGRLRRLGRLALPVALALALAGIQLLPTAARLASSPRGGGIDREAATWRSMPPTRLLEWALPHPLGDPMRIDDELFFGQSVNDEGFPYLISIYPGLIVLLLALGGLGRGDLRWRWAWMVMIGGSLLLALGRHNPLYELIVPWLPLLDQTRYPEKLLLLATSALPFVAALAWQARREDGSRSPDVRGRRFDLAALLAAVVAASLAVVTLLLTIRPEGAVWLAATLRTVPLPVAAEPTLMSWARLEVLWSLLVALGGGAILVFAQIFNRGRSRQRLEAALLLLLAFDLLRNDWNLLPVVPLEAVTEPAPVLAGHPPAGRLFTDLQYSPAAQVPLRYERPGPMSFWNGVETLEPYLATLWGYSYALHHDYDLMLTEPARLALDAFSEDWKIRYRALRFAGVQGVGTVAFHRPLEEVLRDRFEGRPEPRLRLEVNDQRLAEFRLLPEVRYYADQPAALEAARNDEYRFSERGYWVGDGTAAAGASEGELAVVATEWARVELRTEAPGRVFLQVGRTWDAGWSARVDGEPTPIYRTATGQMGLVLSGGEHDLELAYTDPLVPAGALLSLFGLGLAAWMWRRSTAQEPAVGF